ncbi:MAG: tetratricopeptide repeat protein [Steroidobacteraceae bacterium]
MSPLLLAKSKADPEKLTPIKVQDLHYGDVLFHYYAEEDFEALTRLKAYENWQRMPNHQADADLLAGGLYLSLGMHNEAGERFERLLTGNVPVGVRNRAWYYLAKVWYTRGYYPKAEAALGRISGTLSPELEAERLHLLVNVLMQQGRFDDAIAKLSGWQGRGDWTAYARFNLGVALVRENRLADADPFLTQVGTLNAAGEELLALRDKANVALGYAHLQANDPGPAQTALARVRLDGPYASKALLGAGWAAAAQGDYKAALTPWLELHQRNLLDAAVQESYLAVPYAFSQLGAGGQAADYYESAIKDFGTESDQLDAALVKLGNGGMLDALLKSDDGRQGWFWQLKQLPDAPESRYLYALLADNDFQEGLKNFRDLTALDRRLGVWQESMEAFGAMIDTREKAYAQKVPAADALLATKRPGQLLQRRAALDTELDSVETTADVAALGTAEERAQWAQVRELEENLKQLPDDEESNNLRARLRLIKGVLYWHFDEQFKERDYEQRRQLREIDAALNEAQNRWVRVQKARSSVPTNTGEFARRVAELSARLDALRARLAGAATLQDRYLEGLAAAELNAQKERLSAYQVQARFALADIYDRAATGSGSQPRSEPPAQDGQPAGSTVPPAQQEPR